MPPRGTDSAKAALPPKISLPPEIWQPITRWLREYLSRPQHGMPPGTLSRTQLQAISDQAPRRCNLNRPLDVIMPADSWQALHRQLTSWQSTPALLAKTPTGRTPAPTAALESLAALISQEGLNGT